jgi:cytochrome d ubiquinol oxidase subunit II
MDLQVFWFCLIVLFWAAYFVLEGFDFGVGMLLPFLPRTEAERGAMFASIGPVWDGGEVWLVIAGGAAAPPSPPGTRPCSPASTSRSCSSSSS